MTSSLLIALALAAGPALPPMQGPSGTVLKLTCADATACTQTGTTLAFPSGGSYTLPAATAGALGGVKGFTNLTLGVDGALSLSGANVTGALGYTPWNPGNDGHTSGLDADTVDGFHVSTNEDATTVVGRDGTGGARLSKLTLQTTDPAGTGLTFSMPNIFGGGQYASALAIKSASNITTQWVEIESPVDLVLDAPSVKVGNVSISGFNMAGNASTATALAADPTDCGAGTFATGIAANGNLTCAAGGSGSVVVEARNADDLNTKYVSGFYGATASNSNRPSDWGSYIVARNSDVVFQMYGDYTGQFFVRGGNPAVAGGTGTWGSWQKALTTGTSGNLHLDPSTAGTNGTYFNYIRGTGGTFFCNGAGACYSSVTAGGMGTFANTGTASGAVALKPGTSDNTFISFYADTQSPDTRSGWIGYGTAGNGTMSVANDAGPTVIDGVSNDNGALRATTGVFGASGYAPLAGDIGTARDGTPTTAAIYFGNSGGKYIYYDGSNFLANGGAWQSSGDVIAFASDRRLKTNIVPISDPLGKLAKIHGYTFDWDKAATKKAGFDPGRTHDVGVIAQEIEAVLPDLVVPAPFTVSDANGEAGAKDGVDYKTVRYDKLTALLIEAVKAQQEQIKALTARVEALEAKK